MCCPMLELSYRHLSQVADTPQTKPADAPQAADTPQVTDTPLLLLLDAPSTEPKNKMAFPDGRVLRFL
jgi:hypothetical protein